MNSRASHPPLRLIIDPVQPRHVSEDAVLEAEGAVAIDTRVRCFRLSRAGFPLRRLLWGGYVRGRRCLPWSLRLPAQARRHEYLAVLMGPAWSKCLPYFAAARSSALYLFDAWPDTH